MPNVGYPDDDGSRDAQGQHDEGRQRNNIYDVQRMMTPATVADYGRDNDPLQNVCTSTHEGTMPPAKIPIDGDANATGRYDVAAYPAYSSED